MLKKQTNLVSVYKIITFLVLLGPFGLGVMSYIVGNYTLGHASMGIFILLLLIYYFLIKGHLEEDPKSSSLSKLILHVLIIIQFLIGPIVWAGFNFWGGNLLTASIMTCIFFVSITIYLLYGKKYFQAIN